MSQADKEHLDYTEQLRLIGQLIQQERLTEVSILEYDQGWIIHGLTYRATAKGLVRATSDFLVSIDDLRKLRAQAKDHRQEPQPTKRRWGL